MRAAILRYEVHNPRWKKPSIRFRVGSISFCCDESKTGNELWRFSVAHGNLILEYQDYEYGWQPIDIPIKFCPFCGTQSEIEITDEKGIS